MAVAVEADQKADAQRTVTHYRCSLRLDPEQPACLAELGLLLLRLGQAEEGLGGTCAGRRNCPGRRGTMGKLVEGLRLTNRADEARSVLRAALFRNPRDARFRRLSFQLPQELRKQQDASRRSREAAAATEEHEPVLLPFLRPVAGRSAWAARASATTGRPPSAPRVPRPVRHAQ